jgi:hypothetical protein
MDGGDEKGETYPTSIPTPIPKPEPSCAELADVAERGVVSIGVHSSGNLCVGEEYVICCFCSFFCKNK